MPQTWMSQQDKDEQRRYRAADLFIKTYGAEAFADWLRDPYQNPECANMRAIATYLERQP